MFLFITKHNFLIYTLRAKSSSIFLDNLGRSKILAGISFIVIKRNRPICYKAQLSHWLLTKLHNSTIYCCKAELFLWLSTKHNIAWHHTNPMAVTRLPVVTKATDANAKHASVFLVTVLNLAFLLAFVAIFSSAFFDVVFVEQVCTSVARAIWRKQPCVISQGVIVICYSCTPSSRRFFCSVYFNRVFSTNHPWVSKNVNTH